MATSRQQLGSQPPLRHIRDRAPGEFEGRRGKWGDNSLARLREGQWGRRRGVRDTPDRALNPKLSMCHDNRAPRNRTTSERENAASFLRLATWEHANP